MNLNENLNWPIPFNNCWNDLDSSKIQDYIECPRKFFYRHVLGWQTNSPNNHLIFGQAVHIAMEHLYINGFSPSTVVDAFQLFLNEYRTYFPEHTDEWFEPKTPNRFFAFLSEYIQKYADDFRRYKVLYTEVTGRVNLTEDENIIFKIDAIIENKNNNRIKTLEHKTKQGDFNSTWDNQWTLGIQAGTYTHALYSIYPPNLVDGVLINGLGFKKTKSYMFSFTRVPVYKNNKQMQIWLTTILSWIDLIKADFEKLSNSKDIDPVMAAFRLNPKSCTNYATTCTYHDFCCNWTNPLQEAFSPPLGYEVKFWDPLVELHSTTNIDEIKLK